MSTSDLEGRENKTGAIKFTHALIVLLSLTMTIGAYLYTKHQSEIQLEARFMAARDQTIGLIEDRMSRYEDALWSGVAYADSLGGDVGQHDWRVFANSLKIEDRYPGVNGIGMIYKVERPDLDGFLAAREADGWSLNIYPDHSFEPMLPITYIVPEDINRQAIGLDVAHEENRRTALLASRDTGTAQITGPIVLVQDSGHTPGFLFYTPFYSGSEPNTLEERRARFAGVVYAPFVVKNLVEGLLAQELRNVRFSIRDGDEFIYDEHQTDDPAKDTDPLFSDTVTLNIYGRDWVIDIRTDLAFRAQNVSNEPLLILLGGLIIEILVISMLVMLVRANSNARSYAENLNKELREKSERLEQANAEIEQFVYIASHDLKTPVRGIGFLTDMIEEDLVEKIGKLDDMPEFASNFAMIRGRVDRMNDLTSGIMEFFRASNGTDMWGQSVKVRDIISDCRADFELRPEQITCVTDTEDVCCGAINFRSILENLIGNAVKYHPDRDAVQIKVEIRRVGGRLHVSVADNGKGIAPEFHEKIFEVFQTLRRSDDPESTGIGLAIVKKAVLQNGGNICVISEPGSGATFQFDWPDQAPMAATAQETAA